MNQESIFFYVGLIATILFCIKNFLLPGFGGDSEVFTDFNSIEDTDTSFSFLSVSSVLAFLIGGGWFGWVMLKYTSLSIIIVGILSGCVGLMFMFGYAYLMFCIRKFEEIPDKSLKSAVGKTGKAYTHFEPKGEGQVEVDVNGTLSVVDAVNVTNNRIEAFTRIKVIKEENNMLYIENII